MLNYVVIHNTQFKMIQSRSINKQQNRTIFSKLTNEKVF